MEFGEKIKKRRLELNLTLEELAQKVGVSAPTIQRYETGEIKNVRRDKISKLASALDLTPAYLMGWEEPEEHEIQTIAAHHDGDEWTEEELNEIEQFKAFVRMRKAEKAQKDKK